MLMMPPLMYTIAMAGQTMHDDTVEPLNKDTLGTSRFVLCREVVFFLIFYRVCIREYFKSFGLSFSGLFWSVLIGGQSTV